LCQKLKWKERFGTVVMNKFYFWEVVEGKQIPYESEEYYQIDNSSARVGKSRPVDKIPEFHPKGRQIALLVLDSSGRILLEKDMNGLRNMPILLTKEVEQVEINCLIDRVYAKWDQAKVSGPYEVGLVDYYYHEKFQDSILTPYDVDPDQITFETMLCYLDFRRKKAKKPSHRLVHDVVMTHTFSRVTVKTGECAFYLAEAFNLTVTHKGEATLIGYDGDSFEKIVMENRMYQKGDLSKKKNKKNRRQKAIISEPPFRSVIVKWDDINRSMMSWEIIKKEMNDLYQEIISQGDVVVFPSRKEKDSYCGYLSTLSYFLRGRDNGS